MLPEGRTLWCAAPVRSQVLLSTADLSANTFACTELSVIRNVDLLRKEKFEYREMCKMLQNDIKKTHFEHTKLS